MSLLHVDNIDRDKYLALLKENLRDNRCDAICT